MTETESSTAAEFFLVHVLQLHFFITPLNKYVKNINQNKTVLSVNLIDFKFT